MTDKQIMKIVNKCEYRKRLNRQISICTLACLPCKKAVYDGRCPMLKELLEGDTDES